MKKNGFIFFSPLTPLQLEEYGEEFQKFEGVPLLQGWIGDEHQWGCLEGTGKETGTHFVVFPMDDNNVVAVWGQETPRTISRGKIIIDRFGGGVYEYTGSLEEFFKEVFATFFEEYE